MKRQILNADRAVYLCQNGCGPVVEVVRLDVVPKVRALVRGERREVEIPERGWWEEGGDWLVAGGSDLDFYPPGKAGSMRIWIGPNIGEPKWSRDGSTTEVTPVQRPGTGLGKSEGVPPRANLDGPWAKLARAREFRMSLSAEMNQYFDPAIPSLGLVGEIEADGLPAALVVYLAPKAPIPLDWGILIGDAVHNYRSALDQLTWQLAIDHRRGRKPTRDTQFPVCREEQDFEAARGSRLKHVDSEHADILMEFQPFRGPRGTTSEHPLNWLNALSNQDKHQVVPTVSIPLAKGETLYEVTGALDVLRVETSEVTPVRSGQRVELARLDIRPHGRWDIKFTPHLEFYLGLEDSTPVSNVLLDIEGIVREILKVFEPLL